MTLAYVLCVVKSGHEDDTLKMLSRHECIKEHNLVYGEYDIVIKVEVSTPDELREFLTKSIRNIPFIDRTTTLIAV